MECYRGLQGSRGLGGKEMGVQGLGPGCEPMGAHIHAFNMFHRGIKIEVRGLVAERRRGSEGQRVRGQE